MNPEIIDNVNNPSHYQGRYGMESIDALRNFMTPEQLKGFYLGNALKYQLRFQKKNGLEDLKKARKNLEWLIEEMEHEGSKAFFGTNQIVENWERSYFRRNFKEIWC